MAGRTVVAGHICLDIIPTLTASTTDLETLLAPGRVVAIDSTRFASGGAVANVGLALAKLGLDVRLAGKIGDDPFGARLRRIIAEVDERLAASLLTAPGAVTSYTFVIAPRGRDRTFLHFTGPNDEFSPDEIGADRYADADLLHFGYPPAMRLVFADGGERLSALFRRVKQAGLTVSLDLSYPPAGSEAASVDWRAFLRRVLPFVDLFCPGYDEISFMLPEPTASGSAAAGAAAAPARTPASAPARTPAGAKRVERLRAISDELCGYGCALCAIKLGSDGLYVKSCADAARIGAMGRAAPVDPAGWAGRELVAPCFDVEVVGTTGSGDCTAAGFIAALHHHLPFDECVTSALAVGACSVEGVDATGTIPQWESVRARIAAGWRRRTLSASLQS